MPWVPVEYAPGSREADWLNVQAVRYAPVGRRVDHPAVLCRAAPEQKPQLKKELKQESEPNVFS
ncbi:MAG: hypothetical protein WAM91_04600 [Candidatus Acidiferrales bacterium]